MDPGLVEVTGPWFIAVFQPPLVDEFFATLAPLPRRPQEQGHCPSPLHFDPRGCGSPSHAERGELVRALAAVEHLGPDGSYVKVSRPTLDRWIRAWRPGGFDALAPKACRGVPVTPRELLVAEDLKKETPRRTAVQIAEIIKADRGRAPSARTIQCHFAMTGLNRTPDGRPPKAFGRFEALAPKASVPRPEGGAAPGKRGWRTSLPPSAWCSTASCCGTRSTSTPPWLACAPMATVRQEDLARLYIRKRINVQGHYFFELRAPAAASGTPTLWTSARTAALPAGARALTCWGSRRRFSGRRHKPGHGGVLVDVTAPKSCRGRTSKGTN